MKFFEFKKGYEYYALIAIPSSCGHPLTQDIQKAILCYAEDIVGDYFDYIDTYSGVLPVEISISKAFEEYKTFGFGDTPEKEISKKFYTMLDKIANNGEPAIILIDSDLI